MMKISQPIGLEVNCLYICNAIGRGGDYICVKACDFASVDSTGDLVVASRCALHCIASHRVMLSS
jgi:hypothetical protein